MAFDITGSWDFIWSGLPEVMSEFAVNPLVLTEPFSTHRVYFFPVGANKYRGRFYNRELPQRSFPNFRYDSIFDVQILTSDAPTMGFDIVMMTMRFRSTENVKEFDSFEAIAGHVRPQFESTPIMYGFLYSNNGNADVWKMSKVVPEPEPGPPDGFFGD